MKQSTKKRLCSRYKVHYVATAYINIEAKDLAHAVVLAHKLKAIDVISHISNVSIIGPITRLKQEQSVYV